MLISFRSQSYCQDETKRKRTAWERVTRGVKQLWNRNEGPVHTTLEEFENVALFLWLDLPSTLIRRENGVLRKRSLNWCNLYLKTPAFRFRADKKHFENGAFGKGRRHDSHVISLTEFSWNTNPIS